MSYLPIEDHGLIGNMRTTALVGVDGTIDWMCFPGFDSPSVFASILDDEKGGYFRLAPAPAAHTEGHTNKQNYWPDTNVLVTTFLSEEGVAQVVDFMPAVRGPRGEGNWLVRRVTGVRGVTPFKLECFPAFNFARDSHELVLQSDGTTFRSELVSLRLHTTVPLKVEGDGVTSEFTISEGESVSFVLREADSEHATPLPLSNEDSERLFDKTVRFWRGWLSQCTYKGRWREKVHRSALALKLMTNELTGAIVAAPTTSLPENIGGERNWDYRYTWIRDAAFTLYALMRIGFTDEAAGFMKWLEARCRERNPDGSLQIMYGIDGRHELTEETLSHLSGYRDSGPVRIGNGAYDQLQLDIYGELLDSVYLYDKHRTPISYDLWCHLRELIDWVCENWQREDEGIWEVRGGQRRFVYSALMCWVALDRGLRLAIKRSFPVDRVRWEKVRDAIYEEIMERGWNEERQAFVQSYGSDVLDASNLIMPLVFFMSPSDPRMIKTLEATLKSPAEGGLVANSLVYRYDVSAAPDGLEGEEGTFNLCTFWLVEALTRAGRTDRDQLRQARWMFEQMLGYSNHLGLYAEETGPKGEALGNFPQAFTHLALISAAFNLDRALGSGEA